MSLKELKKAWKKKNLKEMDKYAKMDRVYDAIPELIKACLINNKRDEILGKIEDENSLTNIIISEKFIKTVKNITNDENYGIDEGLAVVYNTVLTINFDKIDEDTRDNITKIISKILKKRIKKIAKKTELEKDVIQEFAVVLPSIEILDEKDHKKISMFTDKMLMKAYTMAKEDGFKIDKKQLKKLFTSIAGKESLANIATGILLQRKQIIANFNTNQLVMWGEGTDFALSVFNKMEDYELERCLKYYDKIITKFPGARRLELDTLPEEDYPRIVKVMKKIEKKK